MTDLQESPIQTAELAYTTDLAALADQYASGKAYGAGGTLVLAIGCMRQGFIYFGENKGGQGSSWKGLEATMRRPEMHDVNKTDVSKATKVVSTFLPEVLTCDEDDIVSHVLTFVNEHKSLDAAYNKWNEQDKGRQEREPKAWNLRDAFATVLKKAAKEGLTLEDVEEAYAEALKVHFPT